MPLSSKPLPAQKTPLLNLRFGTFDYSSSVGTPVPVLPLVYAPPEQKRELNCDEEFALYLAGCHIGSAPVSGPPPLPPKPANWDTMKAAVLARANTPPVPTPPLIPPPPPVRPPPPLPPRRRKVFVFSRHVTDAIELQLAMTDPKGLKPCAPARIDTGRLKPVLSAKAHPSGADSTSENKISTSLVKVFYNPPNSTIDNRWRTLSEIGEDWSYAAWRVLGRENTLHESALPSQIAEGKEARTGTVRRWRLFGGGLSVQRRIPSQCDFFSSTYSHFREVRVCNEVVAFLLKEPTIYSKAAVDAGGQLKSSFAMRLQEITGYKKEVFDLLNDTDAHRELLDHSIHYVYNVCALRALYTNSYSVSAPARPGNGIRAPHLPAQK